MLILGRDIGCRFRCAPSWCDLDLTFNIAVLTLNLKVFVQARSHIFYIEGWYVVGTLVRGCRRAML